MTTTSALSQWKRLGAILIQRRTALNPQWHSRGAFAEATGLSYRLIYDVEEGRRGNFGGATLAAIEAAYELPAGTISQFLHGGELEMAADAPGRPAPGHDLLRSQGGHRVNRSMTRTEDLLPFIIDIAEELAAGKKPSKSEQLIWDSRMSDEEKWNLIAQIRQANAKPAREAETGLAAAGHGPFTAS